MVGGCRCGVCKNKFDSEAESEQITNGGAGCCKVSNQRSGKRAAQAQQSTDHIMSRVAIVLIVLWG